MGKLLVKNKEVVVPGEIIAEGMDYLPSFGTYRSGDHIIANKLGLLNIDGKAIKTIPLSGKYLPMRNDIVIGQVFDILISGWRLDINSPYSAVLSSKETMEFIGRGADLSRYFDLEDYIVTKIVNVTSQNLVDVTTRDQGLRRLKGGMIIKVNTHKVPRIIGKKGSMVSMIKQATGCRIVVGQNGLVWIDGEPDKEVVAIATIHKIENESHVTGLTERIKEYLEKETGVKIKEESGEEENGLR